MKFRCSKCGLEEETSTMKPLCGCGGLWELDYTPSLFDSWNIRQNEWSIFRYLDYLPVQSGVVKAVSLGEGMTGIVV